MIAVPFASILLTFVAAQGVVPHVERSSSRSGDGQMDELAACLRIAQDAARLTCLDGAARRLVMAVDKKDLVVVEREQIRRTRRSLFGLTLDSGDVFAGQDAPADRIEQLDTTLRSIRREANERWTLTLAEGGRWQTSEAWLGDVNPAEGMVVSIHRAALGSYLLKAKGMRAVKVRRVN